MESEGLRLSEAVGLFLVRCSAVGCAIETQIWYRRRLAELVRFLGDPFLCAVTLEGLFSFVSSKREQKRKWVNNRYHRAVAGSVSVHTVDGYVRIIKTCFRWLCESGYVKGNVAMGLERPRLPKLPPKDISISDISKLLDAAKRYGDQTKRNYALVLFLADTGCRVGGLVGLRLEGLDIEKGVARVFEKGGKCRSVFLVLLRSVRCVLGFRFVRKIQRRIAFLLVGVVR